MNTDLLARWVIARFAGARDRHGGLEDHATGKPRAVVADSAERMTSNRAELDELGEEYQRLAASIHCTCTGCGTEIDLERLRARPGAARCLACQERFERMHATPGGARSS